MGSCLFQVEGASADEGPTVHWTLDWLWPIPDFILAWRGLAVRILYPFFKSKLRIREVMWFAYGCTVKKHQGQDLNTELVHDSR